MLLVLFVLVMGMASPASAELAEAQEHFLTSAEINAVVRSIRERSILREYAGHEVLGIAASATSDGVIRACGHIQVRDAQGQTYRPSIFYVSLPQDQEPTVLVGAGGTIDAQISNLCARFKIAL